MRVMVHVTHWYIGPNLRGGKISKDNSPLRSGDRGKVHGKRGGLRSFVRDHDGAAFWVPPKHLEAL